MRDKEEFIEYFDKLIAEYEKNPIDNNNSFADAYRYEAYLLLVYSDNVEEIDEIMKNFDKDYSVRSRIKIYME